jgi:hypothetical protein
MDSADDLANIPIRPTNYTDDEKEVFREYFDGSASSGEPQRISWVDSLKVSGYGILLFVVLGNPWLNNLFVKLPYMSNPLILFCAKLFIFGFVMLILSKFAS